MDDLTKIFSSIYTGQTKPGHLRQFVVIVEFVFDLNPVQIPHVHN